MIDPDTLQFRLARLMADWHYKRLTGRRYGDYLPPDERSATDYNHMLRRERMRDWLRRQRHAPIERAANVVPLYLKGKNK